MENEFPDPEDEFDLMHEDEYEVLRELEESEKQKNTTISTVAIVHEKSNKNNANQNATKKIVHEQNNKNNVNQNAGESSFDEVLQVSSIVKNGQVQSKKCSENSKKRSIEEISQDVLAETFDPLDFNDIYEYETRENKRPCWDKPEELIQIILDKRKNVHNDNIKLTEKYCVQKDRANSISRKVPLHNFVAVTHYDNGERFYIKVSDTNQYIPKTYRPTSGFLLKSFNQLKDEAEQIIVKSVEKASLPLCNLTIKESTNCELWVDKYRPKRYVELLSDENVNRSLLYWLKLWDKIVFDRDPTVRARKPQVFSKFKSKFNKKNEDLPSHDSKGFPTQRIALLTGPPGLGKTTLAHIAARHAGYNIVELNASDDRGPEAFREALLSSTQMRALIDKEKRPNCLILDEIDGAPAASIDLLLKFIYGKLAPKGKNVKVKENDGCRRPIICVCNDLYTLSLRPLRAIALVINVPEISPATLAERLGEIAQKEGLNVDSRILLQLAKRSACDVRACLGILQYTGGSINMLQKLAFGLKDMRKGLFDSWKELLQVPMNRKGILSNSERAEKVIKIVHQGETDRLAHGIFHNYPENNKDKLDHVSKSLQWFQFYDQLNTLVLERQSWMLMPYTTSAFVAWHMYLAGTPNPKISYPTAFYEVNQKLERNKAILAITKKTSKCDVLTLVSEVLPYLTDMLTPRLRSVNLQLYSAKEKHELDRLVNLMLDFGLTFVQEKKSDGGYDYYLDPNIWDIAVFPDCKVRKPLPYAVKQIIVPELEAKRLQRAAMISGEISDNKTPANKATNSSKAELTSNPSTSQTKENVPNHLRQLAPKEVKLADKKCRNFFMAFQLKGQEKLLAKQAKDKEQGIVSPENKAKDEKEKIAKKRRDLFKSDVWFQYKEGYSNAIRRAVYMKDLL